MLEPTKAASHQLPTNRKFGWFFAFVFLVFAAYAYWKAWDTVALITLILCLLFVFLALLAPQILAPLNRFWYGFGLLIGKIVSPIVLGIIYFVLITPISLITRLFGRDELRLKKRSVDTYWVERSPPGPPSDSFKNQY